MWTRKGKELAKTQSEGREFPTQITAGTNSYTGGNPIGKRLKERQCKRDQPEDDEWNEGEGTSRAKLDHVKPIVHNLFIYLF